MTAVAEPGDGSVGPGEGRCRGRLGRGADVCTAARRGSAAPLCRAVHLGPGHGRGHRGRRAGGPARHRRRCLSPDAALAHTLALDDPHVLLAALHETAAGRPARPARAHGQRRAAAVGVVDLGQRARAAVRGRRSGGRPGPGLGGGRRRRPAPRGRLRTGPARADHLRQPARRRTPRPAAAGTPGATAVAGRALAEPAVLRGSSARCAADTGAGALPGRPPDWGSPDTRGGPWRHLADDVRVSRSRQSDLQTDPHGAGGGHHGGPRGRAAARSARGGRVRPRRARHRHHHNGAVPTRRPGHGPDRGRDSRQVSEP